jgi:hypothetical protein
MFMRYIRGSVGHCVKPAADPEIDIDETGSEKSPDENDNMLGSESDESSDEDEESEDDDDDDDDKLDVDEEDDLGPEDGEEEDDEPEDDHH